MDERSRVLVTTVLGAVIGGVFGCLYLTERGCRVRQQLEPMLDAVIDELRQSRETLGKARAAVEEGRRLIDETLHPPSSGSPWESRDLRRASS